MTKPIEKSAFHDGKKIGNWAELQRSKFNSGNLSQERVRLLESLPNWVWDSRQEWWNSSFNVAKAYVEKYGNADIPDEYIDKESGIQLGKWVGKQRSFYKKGTLSQLRIEKLETLSGWIWDKSKFLWQEQFKSLESYWDEGKFDSIKQGDVVTGSLAVWLNHQFSLFQKKKMPPENVSRFESLDGWSWERKRKDSFLKFMDELTKYVDENGEFPKHNYVTPEGFTLGQRFANYKYRMDEISEENRKALRSIKGWKW